MAYTRLIEEDFSQKVLGVLLNSARPFAYSHGFREDAQCRAAAMKGLLPLLYVCLRLCVWGCGYVLCVSVRVRMCVSACSVFVECVTPCSPLNAI